MNRPLLHHFNKLESAKGAVLAELRHWPEERLGRQPASGSWSALEVIEHVILTEQSILGVMRRHLEKPQRIRFKDWLGNARVLGVMLLPMQVRIPRGARAVAPTGQTSGLAGAAEHWTTVRRDLRDFLEKARKADLRGGVVRHPAGGWTNIKGALWFLRAHLRHHRYQLSRIRAALR